MTRMSNGGTSENLTVLFGSVKTASPRSLPNKVGKDLGEAVFTEPNNTVKFSDVPPLDIRVMRGPSLDGLGKYYREVVTESSEPVVDVSETLIDTGAQVLINYLPVGSEDATRFY